MAAAVVDVEAINSDQLHGSLRIPTWALNALIPYLTPDQLRVYLYVVMRTWGSGSKRCWLSVDQIVAGRTSQSGRRLDYGTGVTAKRAKAALMGLSDLNVVVIHDERGQARRTYYQVAPSWYDRINWQVIFNISSPAATSVAKGEGTLFAEVLASDSKIPIAGMTDDPRKQERIFWEENGVAREGLTLLEDEEGKAGVGDIYLDMALDMQRSRRNAPPHMRMGKRFGLSSAQVTAIVDAILQVTGKSGVAATETSFGDKALNAAQDAAAAMIAVGVTTPDDVLDVARDFRSTYEWEQRYKTMRKKLADGGAVVADEEVVRRVAIYPGDLVNTAAAKDANRTVGAMPDLSGPSEHPGRQGQTVSGGRKPAVEYDEIIIALMD